MFEGTELYDSLKDSIIKYAKDIGEYDARRKAIEELYSGIENADIDAELTADLVGDYLFTDEKFVRNLSVNNRNVFQKIYNEIKYLCKFATAGSKVARQLEKVKKTFEQIYRESTRAEKNTTDESGVRYSISKTSKMPYAEQLYKIEHKQLNGSNSLYIGKPSSELQSVGLSNLPFAMNQSDYRKARREKKENKKHSAHAVSYDFFENIQTHFSEAPMIIDNGGKVTIITSYEMKDAKGQDSYVIGGVWLNQAMESDTVNLVKSVYPLDDFVERISKYANEGKLIVINKNKVEQMLATIGIQSSEVSRMVNLAQKSLSQVENNVKPQYSLSKSNSHPIKRGNYNIMGDEITLDAPLGVKSNVQSNDKSNDFAPIKGDIQAEGSEAIAPLPEKEQVNLFVESNLPPQNVHSSVVTDSGEWVSRYDFDLKANAEQLVGRIEYLSTKGKVKEVVEYANKEKFEADILKNDNDGVPASVLFYADEMSTTIDRKFANELNPMTTSQKVVQNPYTKTPSSSAKLENLANIKEYYCKNSYQMV